MPANRPKKRRNAIVALLSALVLTTVVTIITLVAGRVAGVEFSPTHFTSRSFVFYEIPVVHLQVWPIKRTSQSLPVTNLLRSQNHIQVPKGESDTWHLIEISRGPAEPTLGDAELLVSHMELGSSKGTGGAVWETWTRDNPKAAAVFWSVVKRLAERELYLLIPDLFSIAERETDPVKLAQQLDENLRTEYLRMAEDLFEAGQVTFAEDLLEDAASDFPKDHALWVLRGRIRQASASKK